jgi:hypothetical protein
MPNLNFVLDTHIIDPPVTPFSPPHEIKAWILELEQISNPNADYIEALKFAQEWLRFSELRKWNKSKKIS